MASKILLLHLLFWLQTGKEASSWLKGVKILFDSLTLQMPVEAEIRDGRVWWSLERRYRAQGKRSSESRSAHICFCFHLKIRYIYR